MIHTNWSYSIKILFEEVYQAEFCGLSLDFLETQKKDASFYCTTYDYSPVDCGWCSWSFVPWQNIFNRGASAVLRLLKFVCPGWNWCIYPHHKYQVKSHSSPWFSVACAAAIAPRNHFFSPYQKNNLLHLRWSSARLVIVSECFCWISNSVFSKVKSAIPPLFNGPEVFPSPSNKVKLFAQNFSVSSNLDWCLRCLMNCFPF